MTQKNFNRMALQGWDVDDMEVVEQFNLDPSVAYTPEINDIMLEKMYTENVQGYLSAGMSQDQAESKAGKMRAQAAADIKALLNAPKK